MRLFFKTLSCSFSGEQEWRVIYTLPKRVGYVWRGNSFMLLFDLFHLKGSICYLWCREKVFSMIVMHFRNVVCCLVV